MSALDDACKTITCRHQSNVGQITLTKWVEMEEVNLHGHRRRGIARRAKHGYRSRRFLGRYQQQQSTMSRNGSLLSAQPTALGEIAGSQHKLRGILSADRRHHHHHHQKQRRKMTTARLRGYLESWERAFCSRMWNPLKMTIWEIQVSRLMSPCMMKLG